VVFGLNLQLRNTMETGVRIKEKYPSSLSTKAQGDLWVGWLHPKARIDKDVTD